MGEDEIQKALESLESQKMLISELKSKLLDVQLILENNLTKKVILESLKDYVNYDDVQESIKSYLNNFKLINEADNEVLKGLIKHLNHFIKNTKDATKISLYHMELLNDMNFFIENSFKEISKDDRVKIQEIAYEAGTPIEVLIKKAKELGYDVKVASSTVTVEEAGILIDYAINGVKPKVTKPKQKNNYDKYIFNNEGEILNKTKLAEKIIKKYLADNPDKTDSDIQKIFSKSNIGFNNAIVTEEIWSQKTEKTKKNYYNNIPVNYNGKKYYISKRWGLREITLLIKIAREDFGYQIKVIKNSTSLESNDTDEEVKVEKTPIINRKKDSQFESEKIKQNFSDKKIEYKFNYKNILLKGVPGTGKSRTLDNIINNHLNLKKYQEENVLRINIHSASSNADLMQGIGINSNENGNIEYKEKQGLILELIEKATFNPNQPFVLVLEEIQENSLNELIGDLIYLIEDSKRAKGYKADNKKYTYSEVIDEIMKQNSAIDTVKLPNLISQNQRVKRMIIPENLFIFCTSNYRDDRKVIEDNLLRRFEVIEIYPKYKDTIGDDFKSDEVSKFLKDLNESIVSVCRNNGEIHPDRFMIGHSIWLDVETKEDFNRAFLKVITEFKDVKDMHFDDFKKIIKEIKIFGMTLSIENSASYEVLINILQNDCYDFLK